MLKDYDCNVITVRSYSHTDCFLEILLVIKQFQELPGQYQGAEHDDRTLGN